MAIDARNIYTVSLQRLYDTCPKKFEYRFIREISPVQLSEPLERGILFHEDAEEAHSERPTGSAYSQWVKDHEEFEELGAEIPVLVRLDDLLSAPNSPAPSGYYGGVIDLAANDKAGDLWLLDHKSAKVFYNYPNLYSTQQLYMYRIAYALQEKRVPIGVCLSRVRQVQVRHGKHGENVMVRSLASLLGEKITLTRLRQWVDAGRTDAGRVCSTSATTPHPTGTSAKTIRVRIGKRPKNKCTVKALTAYTPDGRLCESVQVYGSTLVHVRRQFYIPSQQELDAVAGDFLSFVRNLQASKAPYRRSPGLHCSWCPYRVPCEASREGKVEFHPGQGENGTPVLLDGAEEAFLIETPNQEVTKAIAEKGHALFHEE